MKSNYDKKQNIVFISIIGILAATTLFSTLRLVKNSEKKTNEKILLLTNDIEEINNLVDHGSAEDISDLFYHCVPGTNVDADEPNQPMWRADCNNYEKIMNFRFFYINVQIDESTISTIWLNDNYKVNIIDFDCKYLEITGTNQYQGAGTYNSCSIDNYIDTDKDLVINISSAIYCDVSSTDTTYYDALEENSAYIKRIVGIY